MFIFILFKQWKLFYVFNLVNNNKAASKLELFIYIYIYIFRREMCLIMKT